ncbi:hypothetical protein [Desulfitobacterium sp. AusDCA]|uniref:hypothetical protein n=1 Tax=Desulfitobacterium sp. AusDCA TaxID=3240383 RepID=UPI003DA7955C
MNLSTALIGLVVAAFLGLAIRYIVKNGTCAACEAKGACHSAGASLDISTGCGVSCTGCHCGTAKAAPMKH